MPIKRLAAKAKDSSKYTKYITFLPLILGFGVTALYEYIMTKTVSFTGEFITLWLTSSSLSLAIYAFIEKFIPSKKKILSVRQNEEMLDSLKSILTAEKVSGETEESAAIVSEVSEEKQDSEAAENTIEPQATESIQGKIILRGKRNA